MQMSPAKEKGEGIEDRESKKEFFVCVFKPLPLLELVLASVGGTVIKCVSCRKRPSDILSVNHLSCCHCEYCTLVALVERPIKASG